MTRRPDTPDCGVEGCTQAEYRMGVCRKHHHLVPAALSIGLVAEIMTASHEIAESWHRRAVQAVEERLRDGARA